MNIERGDILLIELDPTKGSEMQKTRPCIVVTNNVANTISRVLMIVPMTSQKIEKLFPHEVLIPKGKGVLKISKANIAQMRTVDCSRIKSKLGSVLEKTLNEVDTVLKLHLGLL